MHVNGNFCGLVLNQPLGGLHMIEGLPLLADSTDGMASRVPQPRTVSASLVCSFLSGFYIPIPVQDMSERKQLLNSVTLWGNSLSSGSMCGFCIAVLCPWILGFWNPVWN